MNNYNALIEILSDMEKVAKAFDIKPFSIYFLGGSACTLGRYTERATRDFDFVDMHYSATLGKVIRYLNDFDMLEYESTILAPSFKERAILLEQFSYLKYYILAMEDIVVSKIIRMEKKDIEDMDIMMEKCDKILILSIIDEVLERNNLYDSKKKAFIKNLPIFREMYNV